ncbi:hypothetical protein G6F56_013117 [Rhizopus delemar]|nr:hypothetical protein G6F56_013117 [Rhizopus delemar]
MTESQQLNRTIHKIYAPVPSGLVLASSTQTSSYDFGCLYFIGPCLGAAIGLGLVGFIVLYCFRQMKKSNTNLPKWDSENSLKESLPPAYTHIAIPTPVKEKPVDPFQYSPQLALSPSMAGEFQKN